MPNCLLDGTELTNVETNFPWKNYYCSSCRSTFISTGNRLTPITPLMGYVVAGSDYEIEEQNVITRYGVETASAVDSDGTTWVDLLDKSASGASPIVKKTELHSITLTKGGTWTGNLKFRIVDGEGDKIFPFADEAVESTNFFSGIPWDFPSPILVPVTLGYKVQFRSSDSGDGADETCALTELAKVERG